MWVKIKKLTDHKKYNTILDNIFYGNNIFSKCERKNTFNKLFGSIATDQREKYLLIVNSENRSSRDIFKKSSKKYILFFPYIC